MSDNEALKYVTERTKTWRSRDIKPYFVEAINTIEKFGCQVMSVGAGGASLCFSYTTGVYDTLGKPEIITVGLPSSVAHHALNYAVDLMEKGVDLTAKRHAELVGDVDVKFQPVDRKWLHQVMLRTDWYYEGMNVPVLQMIYPDLKNRFQDEDDFDDFFLQPILSGAFEEGTPEYDFWKSHDKTSSLYGWNFPDPPHTNSYLSKTVHEKEEPVTYVSHDENGDWQFLGDRMSDGGGPVISCLHHPIDNDRTLEELHDLPLNWYATRERPGAPWQRFEHPPAAETDNETTNPEDPLLN